MRRNLIYILLGGLLSGACVDALALATSNDVISAQSPANEGYSLNWDYVYKYKGSSSVAIDHYWILTAGHVADDPFNSDIVVNGVTNHQQEVFFHATADLALVRFEQPFPGYYPLHEGEIHDGGWWLSRTYDPLVMVGFGYPGAVTASTFTQSGSTGTKRWGTNRGTSELTLNDTECFKMEFDLADTDHEAGANVNDSGGPVFIDAGTDDWKLAGITLFRQPDNPPYTENAAALVSDYIGWIKSVVVDYDTDMDGLPDWWETEHGGDATSMAASVDLDVDSFTNYEEWLADTNPTNGNSLLEIMGYSTVTNLVFSSSTNRKYQVEYRTDLTNTNETWLPEGGVDDWFIGSLSQTVHSVSDTSSNRFYRVRAKLH